MFENLSRWEEMFGKLGELFKKGKKTPKKVVNVEYDPDAVKAVEEIISETFDQLTQEYRADLIHFGKPKISVEGMAEEAQGGGIVVGAYMRPSDMIPERENCEECASKDFCPLRALAGVHRFRFNIPVLQLLYTGAPELTTEDLIQHLDYPENIEMIKSILGDQLADGKTRVQVEIYHEWAHFLATLFGDQKDGDENDPTDQTGNGEHGDGWKNVYKDLLAHKHAHSAQARALAEIFGTFGDLNNLPDQPTPDDGDPDSIDPLHDSR